MPTNCIDLTKTATNCKPIYFEKVFDENGKAMGCTKRPDEWENIELIVQNYNGGRWDLLFAYDTNHRGCGCFYFGKWNDGVVE